VADLREFRGDYYCGACKNSIIKTVKEYDFSLSSLTDILLEGEEDELSILYKPERKEE
jgi:hypothetical protein